MDVEAVTDPHRRVTIDEALARSPGTVIFTLSTSPATTTTRPPRASTRAASSVASLAGGVGADQDVARERLGRLDGDQFVARFGLGDDDVGAVASDPLHRVRDRQPGMAPSAPASTASTTAAKSDGVAIGRAASCTTITSASPHSASPARTTRGAGRSPDHHGVGAFAVALVVRGDDEHHVVRRRNGPRGRCGSSRCRGSRRRTASDRRSAGPDRRRRSRPRPT